MKEFLKTIWGKLVVIAATIISVGTIWTLFCQFQEYNVSADELQPVLTQVAANSKEIKALTQAQERAALMSLYESTFNMINTIQSQWAGKHMPLEEQQRLKKLRLQLLQLEMKLNK